MYRLYVGDVFVAGVFLLCVLRQECKWGLALRFLDELMWFLVPRGWLFSSVLTGTLACGCSGLRGAVFVLRDSEASASLPVESVRFISLCGWRWWQGL